MRQKDSGDRQTLRQIAGITEEWTHLKTNAERLKNKIVELSWEDAAGIG